MLMAWSIIPLPQHALAIYAAAGMASLSMVAVFFCLDADTSARRKLCSVTLSLLLLCASEAVFRIGWNANSLYYRVFKNEALAYLRSASCNVDSSLCVKELHSNGFAGYNNSTYLVLAGSSSHEDIVAKIRDNPALYAVSPELGLDGCRSHSERISAEILMIRSSC
jgi:hypothetical protein